MKSSERRKTALWVFLVWFFSFLCYTPMLLDQLGAPVPAALFSLKYGFLLVPALVTLLFSAGKPGGLARFARGFRRITRKEAVFCGCAALAGISFTSLCSLVKQIDFFGSAYSSLLSMAGSCVYLFVTALLEEFAWRGWLFQHILAVGGRPAALFFTGAAWAVWHLPMWLIRNSLGLREVAPLFLWAMLLSVVLGLFYEAFGNLISAALLHMLFNTCFLAPTAYQNILVLFGIVLFLSFEKWRGKTQN